MPLGLYDSAQSSIFALRTMDLINFSALSGEYGEVKLSVS